MTTSLATTARSFWDRTEGKFGKWMLAAGLAGVGLLTFLNWNALMVWLITTLANTFKAAALIGGLVALLYILFTENRVKTLVVTMFQVIMYHITNMVIDLNPIAILKNCLRSAKQDEREIQEQEDSLIGVEQLITESMRTNNRDRDKALKLAHVAEQQGKATEAQLNMIKAARLAESNRIYEENLGAIAEIKGEVEELHGVVKFTIGDMESEIEQATQRYKVATAVGSVARSAMRILRYNDRLSLYDETLERLADDYSKKVGMIKSLKAGSRDIIANIKLQQGVLAEDGRRQLEDWRKGVKALMPGVPAGQKALPEGTDGNVIDVTAAPEAVPVPRRDSRTDFDDLLKS